MRQWRWDALEIYDVDERTWMPHCVAWVAHQIRCNNPQAAEVHRRNWGHDGHRYPLMRPWRQDPITAMAVAQELARCGHPDCQECQALPGRVTPTAAEAGMAAAEQWLEAGEHARALDLLRDLSGRLHMPPPWWRPQLSLRYHLTLGDALRATDEPAKAARCYERLLSLEMSSGLPAAELANTWGRLTVSRAAAGEASGAAEAFEHCIALSDGLPHHAWSYRYGQQLLKQEAWTPARQALRLASEQADPDHARINDALLWALAQELVDRAAADTAIPPTLHDLFSRTTARLKAVYTEQGSRAGLDIVVRGEVLYLVACGRAEAALEQLTRHTLGRSPDRILAHVWWALAEALQALDEPDAAATACAVVAQWGEAGSARLAERAAARLAAGARRS